MRRLHICARCGAKFTNDRQQQRYCDVCIYTVVNEQDKEIRILKNDLSKYTKALEEVKKITKEFNNKRV